MLDHVFVEVGRPLQKIGPGAVHVFGDNRRQSMRHRSKIFVKEEVTVGPKIQNRRDAGIQRPGDCDIVGRWPDLE